MLKMSTVLLALGMLMSSFAYSNKATNAELKIGLTQEFDSLNPIITTTSASFYIYMAVNRRLMSMDENGKYFPTLLTEIPSLENGQAKLIEKEVNGEKKRWIEADWVIKEKAKWGDGTPVTGHDVEFAWKVGMSDGVSVGERETYNRIEAFTIDQKNPKKFHIKFREAKWDFNRMLTFPVLPKHLEEKIFLQYKNENGGYEKHSLYVKDPTNPGLYNGPYKVTEIKLGSHVIAEKNKYFYGEPAHINKLIFKIIPNSGTLEANLRSGNIDMISNLGLPFDQALGFEKKVKIQKLPYHVKFVPGLTYEHIDLNLDNPLLKDVRVRQALVYSINRPELTLALFEGRQPAAIHNLAPQDPWYTEDPTKVKLYKYSLRKAKKLLKEAGWVKGEDGIMRKNGEKLTLQIMTTSGNKTRELVETYLQDQWKKVGIDITIKNEPARVFFGETTRKRNFPAMAMYAWSSTPENTPRSSFHSTNIPSKENGYSGQNNPGWVNHKVDKLIEDIDLEFDHEKRLGIIHQIMMEYTTEVPVIPLYYRAEVSVIPTNMENHMMTGNQESNTNRIEFWNLK